MARKPSPAQLRARRAFAARYGGRKASPPRRKSPTPMARRKSTPRRSSRFGGISQSSIIDGAMAGAAANVASRYIGPWGAPVALAGVGVFRKNTTLQLLAGVSVGSTLAQSITLPGATAAMSPAGVL